MRLFQKDAYIGIDFLAKTAEIIKLQETGDKEVFSFELETPKGVKTIAIQSPQVPQVNALKLELEEFINAIQQNTPTLVSERDGYRAMEVAHQILQKINSNITVQ